MNFHKTIGYLAALLLIVGIGAPDSFAQVVNVDVDTLTVSPPRIQEGQTRSVTVTVELTEAPGDGNDGDPLTVTVALTEASDTT